MLKGIVALVTGGGSGLGRGTVKRVIDEGGRVVICDLPNSEGVILANELGKNALFCSADITSENDIRNALKATKNKFGRLDVVVNCAAIGSIGKVYNFKKGIPFKLEDFNKVLKVNTIGSYNVMRLAVGLIGENEPLEDGYKGVIVNTASISGIEGSVGVSAYAASKAAIISMTLPLAREFASQGIRVCTICPGYFDTPMIGAINSDLRSYVRRTTPHPKRFGKPDEFALLVQLIITNPMLNGEVIRLDGAYRMMP